jgi:pimeloyl-ACP methyl ester carboxylesterase
MLRLRRALSVVPMLLAGACAPPPDKGLTRPVHVPATPYEQRDLHLNDLRLRYIDVSARENGADGLPVLLIHGHTSRIEEYDGLVPALSLRRRVLVMDLPGSGYSDKPDREYSLAFYEDTIMAFLDALGVDRAHLAGGSQGGNLVLRLAHRFPERFERLAPWAPGSAWPAQPRLARAIRAIESYAIFWPMVKIQSRYWYSSDWPKKDETLRTTFTYYEEVMCPGFVRMYFGMAADQVARTLFDIAPEIQHATWLGWGDRDHGANMGEGVKRLDQLLPRSELRVFPGARHSLAAEVPDPLADAIVEFLDRPAAQLPGSHRDQQ